MESFFVIGIRFLGMVSGFGESDRLILTLDLLGEDEGLNATQRQDLSIAVALEFLVHLTDARLSTVPNTGRSTGRFSISGTWQHQASPRGCRQGSSQVAGKVVPTLIRCAIPT